MSTKTPKHIVLGLVASLVFAPFVAIAPASATAPTAISISGTSSISNGVFTIQTADMGTLTAAEAAKVFVEVLVSPDPAVPTGFVSDVDVTGVVDRTDLDLTDYDEVKFVFAEVETVGLYRFRVFYDADASASFTAGEVAGLYSLNVVASNLADYTAPDTPLIPKTTSSAASIVLGSSGTTPAVSTVAGWCTVNTLATSGTAVYTGLTSTSANSIQTFSLVIPVSTVVTSSKNLRISVSGPALFDAAYLTYAINQAGGDAAYGADYAKATRSADGKRLDFEYTTSNTTDVKAPDSLRFDITGLGDITVTVSEVNSTTSVATTLGSVKLTTLSACDNGAYDSTKSGSKLQTVATAITATTYAAGLKDEVGANKVSSRIAGVYLAVWLRDKYGHAMSYTSQALVATATNGAFVSWDGTAPAFATATTTTNFTDEVLWIKPGTAVLGTAFSTDVTITLNGVEVAKRTISFTGDAATITISDKKASIAAGEETADAFKVVVKDSAGNQIADAVSVDDTDGVYVTGGTDITTSTTAKTGMDITCAARLGKGSVTLAYGRLGAKSETVEITCAGGIASFEVSTNKTAYGRAEIGVFTITAKDSAGQPVADGTALATAAAKLQFTGSGATFAKTPAAADVLNDGKIDYAFTTSATAGSYNFAVWHGDLSPAVTKIASFAVNAAPVPPVVVPPVAPTLTGSLNGRVLLFGSCQADEGDLIVYVKNPGKPWQERAKTFECAAGEFDGSIRAPKSTKFYRVKQEGTGLWSSSVLIRR